MTDMNMIPQNLEAEQSVLGGMMLDSGSDRCQTAMSMLKPESFYIRPHQVIFAEMRELVASQKPIDLITLIESLESKGLGEQAGGFAYMAEISKNTPSAANIVHYAMLVREKAMERYGIDKLTSATELLFSRNGMTTSQKFDAIQTLFTDIADYAKTGNRRGLREFSDVMGDWVDEVEARWSDSDATRGLSTGIGSLDGLLQPKGLVKGALMVIGARPKMGKTTLYSQLAVNCAEVEQLPALMFSLEMPDKQIVERMIGQVSRVNTDVFYGDRYDDAQVAMAFAAGGRLAQTGNLYVDDTPGITLAHIVAESRRIKRERGAVGMVLVDYQKFPGGLVLQWGTANVSGSSGTVQNVDITFPLAFANAFKTAAAVYSTADPSQRFVGIDIGNTSKTKIRLTCVTPTVNTIYWLALGS